MALEDALRGTYFTHLEYIAREYHLGHYFYNYNLGMNFYSSAQYFVLYLDAYADVVHRYAIEKIYAIQETDAMFGFKIFKLDEKNPLKTIYEVIEYAKFIEVAEKLFKENNIAIPIQTTKEVNEYIRSCYMDENERTEVIVEPEPEKKKGGIGGLFGSFSKRKDITEGHFMSKEAFFQKYDRTSKVRLNSAQMKQMVEEICKTEWGRYSQKFDNEEEKLHGWNVIYVRTNASMVINYYNIVYPFLKEKKTIRFAPDTKLLNINIPNGYIEAFHDKMELYGLEYYIDENYLFNFSMLSFFVKGDDIVLVKNILNEIISGSWTHLKENKAVDFSHINKDKFEYLDSGKGEMK